VKDGDQNGVRTRRFADVVVELDRYCLVKGGESKKITPRAFEVLNYLIEHRERVVEKQELFEQIWKESFVGDNSLTRAIKEIRQVIGDSADAARGLEADLAVPGMGRDLAEHIALGVGKPAQRDQQQRGSAGRRPFRLR